MPLKIQEIPAAAADAFRNARPWAEIETAAFSAAAPAFDGARPDLPAHPLYYLGLLEMMTSRSFDRALQIGWRQITQERGEARLSTVDNVSDRSFRSAQQAALDPIESRVSNLGFLRSIVPEIDECELRALTIPPLVDLGIWLKHEPDKRNLVIPIHTSSRAIVAGRVYTEAEIVTALLDPARSLLEFSPGVEPPG